MFLQRNSWSLKHLPAKKAKKKSAKWHNYGSRYLTAIKYVSKHFTCFLVAFPIILMPMHMITNNCTVIADKQGNCHIIRTDGRALKYEVHVLIGGDVLVCRIFGSWNYLWECFMRCTKIHRYIANSHELISNSFLLWLTI